MASKPKLIGIGIGLGAAVGTIAGVLLGHLAIWLAIGMAIGFSVGAALRSETKPCPQCEVIHKAHVRRLKADS